MYNTFRETDPLPRDPSLVDYGFNMHQPDFEELFTPKQAPEVKDEVMEEAKKAEQ